MWVADSVVVHEYEPAILGLTLGHFARTHDLRTDTETTHPAFYQSRNIQQTQHNHEFAAHRRARRTVRRKHKDKAVRLISTATQADKRVSYCRCGRRRQAPPRNARPPDLQSRANTPDRTKNSAAQHISTSRAYTTAAQLDPKHNLSANNVRLRAQGRTRLCTNTIYKITLDSTLQHSRVSFSLFLVCSILLKRMLCVAMERVPCVH